MSKRELIACEVNNVSEEDLDALLGFIHSLRAKHSDDAALRRFAESSLARDWLTPEEEAAWADL